MRLLEAPAFKWVHPHPVPRTEALALAYVALPNIILIAGWIASPLGPFVATIVALTLIALLRRRGEHDAVQRMVPLLVPIIAVATLWCVMAGLGHFVFANADWVVRDAVLVDLVRSPWPVTYAIDGVTTLLRAPIGYFLPASLIGKLWGLHFGELALLCWTIVGVTLTFLMVLRDRPSLGPAMLRMGIFVAFSGMDIFGQIAHYNPHPVGAHLEWWALLFQYSSQTTQLFWVPNHALPGWLAIAWLLGQDRQRLPMIPAVMFVVFTPLWSPLTAVGLAPIFAAALLRQMYRDRPIPWLRQLLDWRLVLPVVACLLLVFPYLVAGSDKVASGSNANVRFVGEEIVPRYLEFVIYEFAGFAILLLNRHRRDPLVWAAVGTLLVLPIYRFGPYNDLAMRASIPALTLLAIMLGSWLATPFAATSDLNARLVAGVLLCVGAVTPFMEFARVFIEPRWSIDGAASVPDVTRGTHYLTPLDQPWLDRFLRHASPEVSVRSTPPTSPPASPPAPPP